MGTETDREALAEAIRAVTDLWDEPLDEVHDVPQVVNAILASDWLAARDAELIATTRRQALNEAKQEIRARIRHMSQYDPRTAVRRDG